MPLLHEDEYNRLRARLSVDTTTLDDALMNLPMDQMTIAEFVADAAAVRDEAKYAHERVVADVSANIRNAGGQKPPSEAMIKAEVPLFDEVQAAQAALIEADYYHSLWTALANATRTKAKSVETISSLIMSGYISKETVHNERREQMHARRTPIR